MKKIDNSIFKEIIEQKQIKMTESDFNTLVRSVVKKHFDKWYNVSIYAEGICDDIIHATKEAIPDSIVRNFAEASQLCIDIFEVGEILKINKRPIRATIVKTANEIKKQYKKDDARRHKKAIERLKDVKYECNYPGSSYETICDYGPC